MALAVWALMKSMSKHMNKVDFKESPDEEASAKETTDSPSGKTSPAKG